MKNVFTKAAALFVLVAGAGAIAGTTIDFELMPPYIEMPSYTEGDVTFRAAGDPSTWPVPDPNVVAGIAPNWTLGIRMAPSPQPEMRADIAADADYVSVDLGDFAGDGDMLFLEAFCLDGSYFYTQQYIDPDFFGMQTLEIQASGLIDYVVFGARYPAEGGSSVMADNFTYDLRGVVSNSPPYAQPSPASQTVEVGVDDIHIIADVSDFEGDTLSYQWLKDGAVLASGVVATVEGGEIVPLPTLVIGAGDPLFCIGTHVLELSVSDASNEPVVKQVTVNVVDTTAPIIQPEPNVTMLWPPNHELRDVVVQTNAFDNSGAIGLTVGVASSEPPDLDGDGNTIPDFYIDSVDGATGIIQLRLRAERSGTGEGRTYTINITATDIEANATSAVVSILAPHDRRSIK